MEPIVDIQALGFDYPGDRPSTGSPLYENFSLAIQNGELIALLGPSGCGKTTLIRLIAGLLRPTAGRILCAGRLVDGPSRERGVVFQGDTCFPWLTVQQNIAFGLRSKRDESSVSQLLEFVGLDDARDSFPRQLSFGMRQRVALARALAAGAKVCLLDEPLASLDALTRRKLQSDLNRVLRRPGQAALWVTHDLEEALLLGDRVMVVNGRPLRIVREFKAQYATDDIDERRFSATFRSLYEDLYRFATTSWRFGDLHV